MSSNILLKDTNIVRQTSASFVNQTASKTFNGNYNFERCSLQNRKYLTISVLEELVSIDVYLLCKVLTLRYVMDRETRTQPGIIWLLVTENVQYLVWGEIKFYIIARKRSGTIAKSYWIAFFGQYLCLKEVFFFQLLEKIDVVPSSPQRLVSTT